MFIIDHIVTRINLELKFRKYKKFEQRIERYVYEKLQKNFLPFTEGIKDINFLSGGKNSVLRLIENNKGEKFVLRIFPYAPDQGDAQEYCLVAKMFEQCGLNVPQILFCDNNKKIRKKFKFYALLEEYVEAPPLSGEIISTQPLIRQKLAQKIASLHKMTNHLSGKIWLPVNERQQPLKYFAERINLYLSRLSTYYPQLTASQIKLFTDKMQDACKPLRDISSYNLIHGDLQSQNLLLHPNGEIIFLDLERSCFGYLEEDLVCIRKNFFWGSEDDFQLFLSEYYQALGSDLHKRVSENLRFFIAFYHLEKASQSVVKLRKFQRGKRFQQIFLIEKFKNKADHHFKSFISTLEQSA